MNTSRYLETSDYSLRSLTDPALTVAMIPGQTTQQGFSAHTVHGTLLTELDQPSDFAHAFHSSRESYGAEVALPLMLCVLAAALVAVLDIYLGRHPRHSMQAR